MSIKQDEQPRIVNKKFLPRILIGNNKLKYLKCSDVVKNLNPPSTIVKPKVAEVIKLEDAKEYREDMIYQSQPGDFLRLESGQKLFLVNRFNLTTNFSRTVAFMLSGQQIGTSDAVVNLIGQKNYDLLLSALCSVINLELKVRAILALLLYKYNINEKLLPDDEQKGEKPVVPVEKKEKVDKVCQTTETSMELIIKQKQRKRVKRQHLMPYVVKDSPQTVKKLIVSPENFNSFTESPVSPSVSTKSDGGSTLPTLMLNDEDSNASSVGNMSSLSINTLPHLLDNPKVLLNNIEKFTETNILDLNVSGKVGSVYNPTMLTLLDGTQIKIPVKPEDDFHIATPDILKYVAPEYRRKLLLYQAYLDWTYCLQCDEDGYLPLHIAVQTSDVDMVRRQCVVLKMRNESVDVVVGNMTALQMSLYQNAPQSTALLLEFGADPLVTDSENRTCLHLAAEESTDHLRTIVNYCTANHMRILNENEEFWKPELQSQTKEEQVQYLLDKLCQLTDSQGYTPLMVASKIGNYDNVKTLVEMSPSTINQQMPNSGDTALYLAVAAACMDASNRGNMSKVTDNFLKTVQILIENGADPSIDNHSGSNVNLLLTEFKIRDLSLLIADTLTAINCDIVANTTSDGVDVFRHDVNNYMLIKDEKGNIGVTEMNKKKSNNSKPIILENILVDTKLVKIENNKAENNDKPKDVDDGKQFIDTYQKFIKNQTENINHSKKIIVVKKSPTKMSNSKFISDTEIVNTSDSNTKLVITKASTSNVPNVQSNKNIAKNTIASDIELVKTATDPNIKIGTFTTSEITSTEANTNKSNATNSKNKPDSDIKIDKTNSDSKVVKALASSSSDTLNNQDDATANDSNRNNVRDKLKRFLKRDPVQAKVKIPKLNKSRKEQH